jgi:hypothetical protein
LASRIETLRAESWLLRAVGGKFGYLLGALIALLLSSPLSAEGRGWNLLLRLFASVVLVASLHAARPGSRAVSIGVALALTDLAIGRLVLIEGGRWLVVLQAALWLSTLIFVIVTILGAVFERARVDVETLQAALCVYLLLGLIWVYLYVLIALAAPDSFQVQGGPMVAWSDDRSRRIEFMRLLVFSYSTLTSSGHGDLVPATGFTSLCANLEALSGQVYLAVVIARLVGMQTGQIMAENDRIARDESAGRHIPSE